MEKNEENVEPVEAKDNESVEEIEETPEEVSPFSNAKPFDPKNAPEDGFVIIPSDTYKNAKAFFDLVEKINDNYDAKDDNDSPFEDDELFAIGFYAQGVDNTLDKGFYVKPLKDKDRRWLQSIKYGTKELDSRPLAMSSKATGDIRGDAAIAKFYAKAGMGGYRQIPLWHSGIWVTMAPPSDADMLNLEFMLSEYEIELGRTTNRLVYSNYDVIFTRIVSEFAIQCITNCTLKLNNKNDLLDYIKPQDKYLLALGIIQTAYTKGFEIAHSCANTGVIVDNKPKCTSTEEATIDPTRLLRVDRSQLTKEHLTHMSNRTPGSMSIDDVIEYQNTLLANEEAVYNIKDSNDAVVFKATFSMPFLRGIITRGEEWVENIINATQESFTQNLSVEMKNALVETRSKSSLVGLYSSYITKIDLSDEGDTSYVTNRESIDRLLNAASQDNVTFNNIMRAAMLYLSNHVVAMAALPNFTCAKCKEDQVKDKEGPFKDFIPLNVYKTFFDLSASRTSKILKRTID